MFCPECGKKYRLKDYFCKKCGTELKSRVKETRIRKGFSLSTFNIGIIFLIGFGIIILITIVISIKNDQHSDPSLPIFSTATLEVASKFNCPCGSCAKSLDKCGCDMTNGGVEKSREIELELSKGKLQIQVIKEFQIKYNSIKPEFRYLIE